MPKTVLVKPSWNRLSVVRRIRIKTSLEEILKKTISLMKARDIYLTMADEYRSHCKAVRK